MIGRRLASGLYAVPVLQAVSVGRAGRYVHRWRLELECGHVLEDHETFQGDRRPGYAGCPHGCGAEIGALRRNIGRLEEDLIAKERARWTRQRARIRRREARARPA